MVFQVALMEPALGICQLETNCFEGSEASSQQILLMIPSQQQQTDSVPAELVCFYKRLELF